MTGPKYPSQQLRSVSVETFFRGRLDAAARMGEVQRLFEDRLPNLFVPNVQPGEAMALRPYQLRDDPVTPTRSLALSLNQATYVAFDYPGYDAFSTEALEVLTSVLKTLGVEELTRVGYRYDNAIDIPVASDQSMPLDQFLNLGFPPWLGTDRFRQLDLEWRRVWRLGTVTGKLFQEEEGGKLTLRMLLGAIAEPAVSAAKLTELVAATHAEALELFESMITDRFKAFLESSEEESQGGEDHG